MRIAVLVLLSVPLLARVAWPQSSPGATAGAALAVVETYVRAMREGDATSAAAVLHPDYRVASWQASASGRQLFLDTRDGELAAIGKLRRGEWDVRFLSTRVSLDPNGMANVWAKYEFYSFGKLQHCGFESYELFRTPAGWRIINFSDTDTPVRGAQPASVCPG